MDRESGPVARLPRYWTPLRVVVAIAAVAALVAAMVRLWFFGG